jgi:hypothetical protein
MPTTPDADRLLKHLATIEFHQPETRQPGFGVPMVD